MGRTRGRRRSRGTCFSHFILCGEWEAVYLFEGLLTNESEVTVDIVHGDTQGQNLPVFGLAHTLGVELLPRIRNWKDLTFYRPSATVKYKHIDPLFGDPDIVALPARYPERADTGKGW